MNRLCSWTRRERSIYEINFPDTVIPLKGTTRVYEILIQKYLRSCIFNYIRFLIEVVGIETSVIREGEIDLRE